MQMLFSHPDFEPACGQSFKLQIKQKCPMGSGRAIALLTVLAAGILPAQGQASSSGAMSIGVGATTINSSANLPEERLGSNDLIGLTVYDSPELTRTYRVDSSGTIRLPMLHQLVQAAGMYPADLENAVRTALIDGGIMADPIVTVSVMEYRSRPINVVGAVRTPVTFQDTGGVTLLDALSQAGGLADDAGPEILVSHQETDSEGKSTVPAQHIPVKTLFDSAGPSSNIELHGGEVVRVPEAGSFYVVGNVKSPGEFSLKRERQSSVLKALALTRGLERFSASTAYIYRTQGGSVGKSEIPIPLKKIMKRSAPDVPLVANDVLYVPEASSNKMTFTVLGRLALIGAAVGLTLLTVYH